MLAIKNNIMAANAARYLGKSYDALATSVERLSSGLRINSAKDDAAGMAVRELMRADVAVLEQGARNAQDGVSMLQTMEGAMATIDNCLVRMKQLAEQASTGSYSSAQREIMNSEFVEMANEVERISNTTNFNGIAMLNNEDTVSIRFGTADDDAIDVSGADMTKEGLGIETGTGLWSALTNQTNALGDTDTTTALHVDTAALVINIAFTDASDATQNQETMQVSFAIGEYTLQDVVDTINTVSNNPTQAYDEGGHFLGYSAASIEETDDGEFKLKLSARDSNIDNVDITVEAGNTATNGGAATDLFGAANGATWLATTAGDLMGAAVFQEWDEDTLAWVDDTNGAADAGVNILDTDAAADALESITDAIGLKDSARAAFGYKINRLESTGEVLAIQQENLMAAESRISDVDVATEMAQLTRNQVLAQAGTAMLAQANSIPQMALSLLR
jgi:flagellin